MDNSNYSRDRHNEHLGVNKMGKGIRKSPLHQPSYGNNGNKPQPPQPHVYNISKNDFRNIVQQLTGSPSHNSQDPPRPIHNPPRPPSMRLQRIRPPPLTPISRPPMGNHQVAVQQHGQPPRFSSGNNGNFGRPPMGQQQQQQPLVSPLQQRSPRGDAAWGNIAESPISQYMRYLQTSMLEPTPRPSQGQAQPHMQGLLPTPSGNAPFPSPRRSGNGPPLVGVPYPSPRGNGPSFGNPPFPSPRGNGPSFGNPPFPSPRGNGPSFGNPSFPLPRGNGPSFGNPSFPSPRGNGPSFGNPPFPSPRGNGPLLPPPGSQYAFPSPGAYTGLLSPRSPYPVLSPGVYQYPPLTPSFFSGLLGPGPQTPHSPSISFPSSPSGFFSMPSPRWRGF